MSDYAKYKAPHSIDIGTKIICKKCGAISTFDHLKDLSPSENLIYCWVCRNWVDWEYFEYWWEICTKS